MNEKKSLWKKLVQLFLLCSTMVVVHISCNYSHPYINKDEVSKLTQIEADSLFNDLSSRSKWSDCVLNKVQIKYPNGLKGVSTDSIVNDLEKMGSDCFREVPRLKINTQSHFFVKLSKIYIMKSPGMQDMKEQYRVPYCDCVIADVKKLYPKGFVIYPPDTTKDSLIIDDCSKKVGLK